MKYNIKEATNYIAEFLGFEADAVGMNSSELKSVPVALTANYFFYNVELVEQSVVFACAKKPEDCSPIQLAKHQELLRNLFQRTVIFVRSAGTGSLTTVSSLAVFLCAMFRYIIVIEQYPNAIRILFSFL